jgi:acyl-CoA reductase-like NAD-dependent aldehyde dehydrogenase
MFEIISPGDGSTVAEIEYAGWDEFSAALDRAGPAQRAVAAMPLEERVALCDRVCEALLAKQDELALELTRMMGRPIRYTPGEIATTVDRARTMMALAPEALADIVPKHRDGFHRYIQRAPLGVVLVVPAWNYPYMIAVNAVVPAVLAGNSVVLKHSAQTALVGDRFAEAFREAGAPEHLVQSIHADHDVTGRAVADERVDQVCFTGSVAGGHAISQAAGGRFIACGLELGGKDPAYVREDADVALAIDSLQDGAFFNSGQSCCGVERVYVHEKHYDDVVAGIASAAKRYTLGDPEGKATDLGPMCKASGAAGVREHIAAAIAAGATAHVDEGQFARAGGNYVAPQVLTGVDHSMAVMKDETFGPVVGIMKVRGDDEAVELMNDSPYGLTASVWTNDEDAAVAIGERVETGTFFMNRCDYLDPELAWVGVKDTGRGCTLSIVGFESLTRPKSFHLRRPS